MEYPAELSEIQEKHGSDLEYAPFELTLGGKVFKIVIGGGSSLYLLYETQGQILFGVDNLEQGPLIGQVLYHFMELWSTSVMNVPDDAKFQAEVLRHFMDGVVEHTELSETQLQKATEFLNSLGESK